MRADKSSTNSWRSVAATFLSCYRLARTTTATGVASAVSRMGRRPCPTALAKSAKLPVCQRLTPGVDRGTIHLQHGYYRRDSMVIRTQEQALIVITELLLSVLVTTSR